MTESTLKALMVVMALSAVTLMLAQPAFAHVMSKRAFLRRAAAWMVLTLIAFLAPTFWLFVAASGLVLLYLSRNDPNPAALYLFVLFAVPVFAGRIPGFGLVNYLFYIDYPRLLALTVLLPAFLVLVARKDSVPIGRTTPDLFLLAYVALTVVLELRGTTVTDTSRFAFYSFTDVFLPYYVLSRGVRDIRSMNEVAAALSIGALCLAATMVFSTIKDWHLYSGLGETWGLNEAFRYKYRMGLLRATGTGEGPIVAGYAVMVGLAFFYYLRPYVTNQPLRWWALLTLGAGLLVSLSRGPWVGALVFLLTFYALGPKALDRILQLGIALLAAFAAALVLPHGAAILDLLPYVGESDQGTVAYRELLWEQSLQVISQNPWLGAMDYKNTPEMAVLKPGGGGIVDVVNTYLHTTLHSGLIGLFLFTGFLVSALYGVARCLGRSDRPTVKYFGITLCAVYAAIAVTIFTVSFRNFIPVLFWSVGGLCVAYASMARETRHGQAEAAAATDGQQVRGRSWTA